MYTGLHVKYPLHLSDFNETCIFLKNFRKCSNKFHENPSSGSGVVPCGRTDMSMLVVTFRNFMKAPKSKGQAAQAYSFIASLK